MKEFGHNVISIILVTIWLYIAARLISSACVRSWCKIMVKNNNKEEKEDGKEEEE